jgi:hypothetical protein
MRQSEFNNVNTDKMPQLLPDPQSALEEANRKIILYGTDKNITDWPKHDKIMQRLYAKKRRALAQLNIQGAS